jgi:transposase
MTTYSKELKDSLVIRMLPPENKSIASLARETGISKSALCTWKKKALENGSITSNNNSTGKWSSQDKFMVVLETASLNEVDLSKYCREKGLYIEQVKAWKNACIQANGGVAEEALRLNQKLKQKEKEYRQLKNELNRKEKALAEAAALLVLKKKADAILGGPEDE